MSDPTTRPPATAADFVEYVAELRADGMSDAEIVKRWMRQARPEYTVLGNQDGVLMGYPHAIFQVGRVIIEASPIEPHHIETSAGGYDAEEQHNFLESALAWLANQLAERCPVACDAPHPTNVMVIQSILNGDPDEAPARIRRIRRMFAIAEPGEVGA